MDRFILIDGNAIMHRAFHALPALSNKSGELTNAVYGFFSMFLKITEDLEPTYIAVCFDRPKPTFRKALYAGYQASRPKMSDDLSPQIGITHSILNTIGIQIFEVDGYEADDLIGTLSKQIVQQARDSKIEVIIVSGDRDLLQLVNAHVRMLAPLVGMTKMQMYDEESVFHKYGIYPSQIVDYKALVGDSSDNYPGVTGIGPKTAKELLTQYQTFENLYNHISEVSVKTAHMLAQDAEQAALAKKLATIVIDAPISLNLQMCDLHNFDKNKARKVFKENGFKSLCDRLKTEEDTSEEVKKINNKTAKGSEQLGLL